MADEEMMEMDELGEGQEGDSKGAGNPLMKYLPLIGVVLVVQIVVIYFAVQWFMPDDMPQDPDKSETTAKVDAAPAATPAPEGSGFTPPVEPVLTIFDQLDIIVVNPAGTDGLRFLSIQVFLDCPTLRWRSISRYTISSRE